MPSSRRRKARWRRRRLNYSSLLLQGRGTTEGGGGASGQETRPSVSFAATSLEIEGRRNMKGARSNPRRLFLTPPTSCTIASCGMLVDIDTGYEGKFDFPARARGRRFRTCSHRPRGPAARISAMCFGGPAALGAPLDIRISSLSDPMASLRPRRACSSSFGAQRRAADARPTECSGSRHFQRSWSSSSK